jgi:hypothetical protein
VIITTQEVVAGGVEALEVIAPPEAASPEMEPVEGLAVQEADEEVALEAEDGEDEVQAMFVAQTAEALQASEAAGLVCSLL